MNRLYKLTLLSIVLSVCLFYFKKRQETTVAMGEGLVIPKEWLITTKHPLTPAKDVRPADQTFLTYPEWFLVFSPEEQANYFKQHTASTLSFKSHTRQIWESYKIVNDQIKDNFPTNTGYHFMIWVIGTSATVEYEIKALYETLVGRITDTGIPLTDEDKFNAVFTQDYVDFIKDRPWYEFDFKTRLKTLWTGTSFFDSHFLRKLDRKYLLTSELLVKTVYGKLIGLGTKQVYEEAVPTTAVILENDSLVYLPRYDQFANAAVELAKKGHTFKEIAGNTSAILLTALADTENNRLPTIGKLIFTQPLTSHSQTDRLAVTIPVSQLHEILLQLDVKRDIKIEHVFDY